MKRSSNGFELDLVERQRLLAAEGGEPVLDHVARNGLAAGRVHAPEDEEDADTGDGCKKESLV